MITNVEVRNMQGNLLSLNLQDYSDGIIIEDIDGLDPVKATLVFSDFAGQDLSAFQSARREKRNLIFKFSLEPDFINTNVRDIRRNLYHYFMPKTNVMLRIFEDDGLVVDIAGRVESFDSPRFTNKPGATISIICEDSNFVDVTPRIFIGNTTAGSTESLLDYAGSVETGFLFTLNVDRTINSFTIYNTPEDNLTRQMPFSAAMVAGDVLKISTVPGNKSAILTHLGTDKSVLYGVAPAANWLNIFPGDNKLRVLAAGAVIPYTISYTDKYGGL